MRIVLDMQGAQGASRFRGIGRYALALARALLAAPSGHEFWLLLSAAMPEGEAAIRAALPAVPAARIRLLDPPGPVRERDPANAWRMQAAELLREHVLADIAPDLVLAMSPCEGIANEVVCSAARLHPGIATAAILYDLIPLQHPEAYLANPQVRRAYLRRAQALRETDLLLTISQSARREALALLDLPEQRVVTIGAGVAAFFRPAAGGATILARHGLTRRVVLYAGAADPRKNLDGLLAAFALLPPALRAAHVLALVGRMEEAERRAVAAMARRHGVPAEALAFLGYVPDEDLRALYSACAAFVFPSLHEGFGLPALEAMACGAPTIASGTSSLPELIGRADAMFDPTRPEAIAERLRAVLEDADFAASLRQSGQQIARQHTWEAAARRALAAIDALPSPRVARLAGRSRPSLAFVSPLPPARTGVAAYAARLLPALGRHYDITCVTDQASVDPAIAASFAVRDPAWFATHHAGFDRILYQVGNSPFHRHMLALLAAAPGVVTLHDFYLSGLMAWRARLGGEPGALREALYESHGYPALTAARGDEAEAVQAYPANATVLDNALRVLVHSRHALDLARAWYGAGAAASLARVPFLPAVPPATPRDRARARLGLAAEDFLVCAFGSRHPTKLNHRLLQAWQGSPLAADPACRLVLVGAAQDDAYERRLAALVAGERVVMTGYAGAATFADYLAAADVAVQLRAGSRGETSGATYECLEHGVPLVVNAHGAAAELPGDAVVMLDDAFTDAALAGALLRLRDGPGLRAALAERGREVVRAAHHPALVAASYWRAIEDAYATSALAREQALLGALARIATASPGPGDLAGCAAAIAATRPPTRPPRILYDVSRLARGLPAGPALPLLTELLRAPQAGWRIEPVRATDAGYVYARGFTCGLLGLGDPPLEDEPVEAAQGDLILGLEGAAALAPWQGAWLRAQQRRGVRVTLLLDDALPVLRPAWFAPDVVATTRAWLDLAVEIAEGILCPSRAAMVALAAWLQQQGTPARHLGWVHPGEAPPPPEVGEADPALQAAMAARPSLLMLGALTPQGGHRQVLAAMERLWEQGCEVNLCILGRPGWQMERLGRTLAAHPQRGRRLFWLAEPSERVRRAVCCAATALIAASEAASSAPDVLVAARHGIAVIARDLPVLREFAGSQASYFRDTDPQGLAEHLRAWLDGHARGEIADRGGPAPPDWTDSAASLLAVVAADGWQWHPPAFAAAGVPAVTAA